MFATVPTRCRSSGPGSATSASRCITIPMGRSSRTACWTAATDFGRATLKGAMRPGNSTALRTGRMMRASPGSGTAPDASDAAAAGPPGSFASPDAPKRLNGFIAPLRRLFKAEVQAALGREAVDGLVAGRRQRDAPLEPALRQLQAVDDGGSQFGRQDAPARHHERAVLDRRLDAVGIDARQGDEDDHRALGFDHVDRRLPGGLARLGLLEAKDL